MIRHLAVLVCLSWQATTVKALYQVCSVQWSAEQRLQVSGGSSRAEVRTLAECKLACEELPTCVAVVWRESSPHCWIHTNPQDVAAAVPTDDQTALYTIKNRPLICQNCQGTWTRINDTNRDGGHVLYSATGSECRDHCLRELNCKAVDWENATQKCHLHQTRRQRLSDLKGKWGDVHSVLNSRTCPDEVDDDSAPDPSTGLCGPTWLKIRNANRIGGHPLHSMSLEQCQGHCLREVTCKEVDWEPPTKKCHVHETYRPTLVDLLYKYGDDHYILLSRTCQVSTTTIWGPSDMSTSAPGGKPEIASSGMMAGNKYIVIISVLSVVVVGFVIFVTIGFVIWYKSRPTTTNETTETDDGYLEPTPIYYTLTTNNNTSRDPDYTVLDDR